MFDLFYRKRKGGAMELRRWNAVFLCVAVALVAGTVSAGEQAPAPDLAALQEQIFGEATPGMSEQQPLPAAPAAGYCCNFFSCCTWSSTATCLSSAGATVYRDQASCLRN